MLTLLSPCWKESILVTKCEIYSLIMTICAAYGCKTRSGKGKDIGLHKFPVEKREPARRKLWLDRLNRGESATMKFKPSDHSKPCSLHFEEDQFNLTKEFAKDIGYGHRFRCVDAVPSLFLRPKEPETRSSASGRQSASAIREKKFKIEVTICILL